MNIVNKTKAFVTRELERRILHPTALNAITGRCLGIVYFWFGALKLVPNLSPAETIAGETVQALTFGLVQPSVSLIVLASVEMLLGVMLGFGIYRRYVIPVAVIHLAFTFSPMWFFPEEVFGANVLEFTLLGQYILKNLVLIAALLSLYRYEISTSDHGSIPGEFLQKKPA